MLRCSGSSQNPGSSVLDELQLSNALLWNAVRRPLQWFWVLFHVLVFHVFYFEVSHGSRLCLASLSLMSSCYWFPCSLCHVPIGLFLSCVSQCLV